MLSKLNCPICKNTMIQLDGEKIKASSYESCLRRCEDCGVAYSNANKKPTIIYQDIQNAIPQKIIKNVESVLQNALNKRNRVNKKKKITFSTSEDAVTWVFFKYLCVNKKIGDLLKVIGIPTGSYQKVYLWGVDITSDRIEEDPLIETLIKVLDSIGESSNSRSEPDVIIHSPGHSLAIIEVKYLSKNDKISKLEKQDKYLAYHPESISDIALARSSGHYELLRNWIIGTTLAKTSPFYLINLGKSNLFEGKSGKSLNTFINSLKTEKGNREFVQFTWEKLLDSISIEDEDIQSYLQERFH